MTLELPLRVERRYAVVAATGRSCGEAWTPEVTRLFAAAPDLLVAAEATVAHLDHTAMSELDAVLIYPAVLALRTAIGRARANDLDCESS